MKSVATGRGDVNAQSSWRYVEVAVDTVFDFFRKAVGYHQNGFSHEFRGPAIANMLLLLGASRRPYEAQGPVRTGAWRPLSPDMLLGGKLVARSSPFSEWGAWDKLWRVEYEDSE